MIVIMYDIACDKRRQAVFEALLTACIRVQLSTFEFRYVDVSEYQQLVMKLEPLIDVYDDQIRLYHVASGKDGPLMQVIGERELEEWRGFHIL
jgi:CRISPR-associated endonuclease Cas2